MKNIELLRRFFEDHRIADTLKVENKAAWKAFETRILVGIARGETSSKIADETLFLLDELAASRAAFKRDYTHRWVTPLASKLAKTINDFVTPEQTSLPSP